MRVHQADLSTLAHKRHRCPFRNLHPHPVRQQTHYGRVLHPGQLLQLRPTLRQRHGQDIAVNVLAKDAEQLRPRQVIVALDLYGRRGRNDQPAIPQ